MLGKTVNVKDCGFAGFTLPSTLFIISMRCPLVSSLRIITVGFNTCTGHRICNLKMDPPVFLLKIERIDMMRLGE